MSVPLSLSKNDSFLFAWAFRAQEKKKKNWNEDERYRCVALLCFRRSLLVVSKELSLLTGWVLKEGLSQDLPKQNKTKKSGIWRTLTSNLTATYLAPPYDAHSVLSFNLPRYPWAKKALNPYQLHAINRNDPAGIGGSQTEKERNWLYKTKDHSSSPSTGFALSLHLQYISSKNGYPEKKNPCSLGRSLVFFYDILPYSSLMKHPVLLTGLKKLKLSWQACDASNREEYIHTGTSDHEAPYVLHTYSLSYNTLRALCIIDFLITEVVPIVPM